MPKKLTDIAAIASASNPWKQDQADNRFFSIRLNRPWTNLGTFNYTQPAFAYFKNPVLAPA